MGPPLPPPSNVPMFISTKHPNKLTIRRNPNCLQCTRRTLHNFGEMVTVVRCNCQMGPRFFWGQDDRRKQKNNSRNSFPSFGSFFLPLLLLSWDHPRALGFRQALLMGGESLFGLPLYREPTHYPHLTNRCCNKMHRLVKKRKAMFCKCAAIRTKKRKQGDLGSKQIPSWL